MIETTTQQEQQQSQQIQKRAQIAADKAAELRKEIATKRLEAILRHCGARNEEIRNGGGFIRTN